MSLEKVTEPGVIPLDRLVGSQPSVQILWIESDSPQIDAITREPHRHDYQELFLLLDGTMNHVIDGDAVTVEGGSVLMLGRGQIHKLRSTIAARCVVVRFSEDLLIGAAQPFSRGWMLALARTCVMRPTVAELLRLESLLGILDGELHVRGDDANGTLVGYLLSAVLAMVRRWQDDTESTVLGTGAPGHALLIAFGELLEAEYTAKHDATWYADQLAVTPNHLAASLKAITGRSTKSLIVDRLMTEAQRLMRYTELPVQQISTRLGYEDPMYFSRAFKAHTGLAPMPYRQSVRQ